MNTLVPFIENIRHSVLWGRWKVLNEIYTNLVSLQYHIWYTPTIRMIEPLASTPGK